MRKIMIFLVVGTLVLSGLGAVVLANENVQEKIVVIDFLQPVVDEQNEYAVVNMQGTNSFLMEQNKPMLPSYTDEFYFPFGTRIKSVTVTPSNIQTQVISKHIIPTPPRVVVGQTMTIEEEPIDYGTEIYPPVWFEYNVGCGRYNGELSIIVDLEVYPIKYHPLEKIIEWAKEMNIVIEYETSTGQTSCRENYELVVLGPSEFSEEIAPLITHKISRGVTSKFVSLTDIYNGVYFPATGRDNQEKIKYFIKNTIENWATSSILLVGGSAKFPTRETHIWIQDEYDQYGNVEVFVSDLYYADIYDSTGGFCSWDSNNNDIFGEYKWQGKTDQVDLHPDVYLGRLACTTESQVIACVNKIKTYENTPGYQQDWFPNLVVVGGDSFPDDDDIDEGEYINQKVIDMMTGFIPNKLWVTNGKLTGINPTGLANIKDAINSGCGFVDFSGHGNPQVWATHPHKQHNIWVPTPYGRITNNHIQELTNGNKLPIVVVEACSTSKFTSDYNCFNWAFIHNPNGGAIGTFGATALGWGYVGTGVSQGLIGKMGLDTFRAYKLNGATTLGEMWAKALERYIKAGMNEFDFKCVEEWESFGDPTLAIAEESQPPAKPTTPSGPTSGTVGIEYTYTTSTTDPEGNKISYLFDWGDGTTSGWVGPFNSGTTATAKKTWSKKGTYEVKVVAKDEHGKLSDWSDPLSVSMPRIRQTPVLLQILEKIFERYPNIFPILRYILNI
ncbi:MAG: C25 family cysteine peptidase [Candidatus Thermoplasmatota archaeon]|jgi:hypothetical protein|nr:C25 family cysteine peptidase [Candidatus Thermoplasmatota archaeon]